MIRRVAGALIVALVTTCTGNTPPHSSAQRIGKLEQAIGGPHAIGQVGDWILENDQVRFIIADKGVGRVNTTFGGTLVDADLQREGGDDKGNDELAEFLPAFVFTVIDPTDVCVPTISGVCPAAGSTEPLADGSDGRPAQVMVTGVGGDMLEMVALLNTSLVMPADLTLTQVYSLEPGKRYVTIQTTIKNTSSGAHPFPYLDPTQLDDLLGSDASVIIPAGQTITSLQLSAPLGQFPLLGGEQKLFVPGPSGFNVRFAIEDAYKLAKGFPAFPGMVADFLASRGPGVSYGLAIGTSPDNYVTSYASGYAGQDVTPYSMLLPFTYAGVTGAYLFKPPDQLMANEEHTYTSYFFVGKGDVGSIYDSVLDLRQTPTGTFGGRVVDELTGVGVPGAAVTILDSKGHPIDELDTDPGGNFLGHLPAGMYTYEVLSDDRLTTAAAAFAIMPGVQTGAFVQMHAPARVVVSTLDELGRRAPAKIQLIAHDARIDGIDGRDILYSLALGERIRPTAFDGTDRYVEAAWWTNNGRLDATVRPGTYDLVVSRGPEYETSTQSITVGAGQFATANVQLARSFDTPGWVAGDFHIHSQPSTDSGLPIDQRVTSCAAEGLEVATATDHNYITDYAPVIASSGLDPWLVGIPGMELTTFEMGHFIAYPLKVDPGSTRGGEFVWAKRTPQQLFDTLRGLAVDAANSVVTVAHPRQAVLGYFAQYFIDASTAQPYTPTGILGVFSPYGDEFQAQNFSLDFDAIELFTGRRNEDIHTFVAPTPCDACGSGNAAGQVVVGEDGRPSFPGVVETWFTMLDHGMQTTGMGTSDSHQLLGDEPGYARTLVYVGDGKDVLGGFTRDDVVGAIRAHHTEVTNAPFIDMTIDGKMIGETVTDKGANVEVDIHVHAPSWAPVDHLVVYTNGGTVVANMPISTGTDFTTKVMVSPTQDAYVVAEVTGSANMFPVLSATEFPPLDVSVIIGALTSGINLSSLPIASKLQPERLHFATPYAITNPIWIDHDGDGKFTAPLAALPTSPRIVPPPAGPHPSMEPHSHSGVLPAGGKPRPSGGPDVRAAFEALPDWSP